MRNKMKNLILLVAMAVFLGSVVIMTQGSVTVSAARAGNVYDDADLLTNAEIMMLNEAIAEFQEVSGWNVYAVTTADAEGKSATAYGDDFFDAHSPEQEDGVAVLIDMDNREIALSTCGEAIRYLTDSRIERILDDAYMDISDGRYGDCLLTMVDGVADAYDAGIVSGQYNYDTETGEISRYRTLTWVEALVALVAALVSGGAVYGIVKGRYQLKFGTYEYDFKANGTVRLRNKEDRFINQTVTHRRIPKQTSSGGGGRSGGGRSSTHRSSSGRSHGGGSRRF